MVLQIGELCILVEKIWDDYIVVLGGGCVFDLIYIDLYLVYEVISLQVFDGLCLVGCWVWWFEFIFVIEDYNVFIVDIDQLIVDLVLCIQVEMLC